MSETLGASMGKKSEEVIWDEKIQKEREGYLSAVKAESAKAVVKQIYGSPRSADAPLITQRVCSSIISYPAFVAERLIQSFDKTFQVGYFPEKELREFIQTSKDIIEKYVGMFAVSQEVLDKAILEEIREQVKFKLNKREKLISKVSVALLQRQRDFLPKVKVAPELIEPSKTKIKQMEVEELRREKFSDWVKNFLDMSTWSGDMSDKEVEFWVVNLRKALKKIVGPGMSADDLHRTLANLGIWLDRGNVLRNLILQSDPDVDKKILDSRVTMAKTLFGKIFYKAAAPTEKE